MSLRYAAFALALFAAPALGFAQDLTEPDEEGCKDSPLLTRMAGCRIGHCTKKEFDAMELQVGPVKDGAETVKGFEGATDNIVYACPSRLSLLQIVRNAENALKAAGFTVVFSGKTGYDQPVVTAQKGPQWVQVYGKPWDEFSGYEFSAVKVQGMAQEMEATADSLAKEIEKSGRAAVYGINFDTGKALLKPESDKILGEIATLLKNNPSWKMKVEGHTDNVGLKAANHTLSHQRAAAVVAWLAGHGVDRARLTSQGFGDTKPLADNASEEGRAKNRRVDLVKL